MLSEEAADTPFATRAGWQRYWLVDPLDGTREFLSRNGQFTVNIALIDSHAPVLGVVHVPVTDVSYRGLPRRGRLARGRGRGGARHPRECRERGAAARGRQPLAPRRLARCASSRASGRTSSCPWAARSSSAWSPKGAADVYPRLGPTSEWDTAAAHAVLAGAGGTVVDLGGAPLRYNTKAQLLNPFFVAYGPSDHDWLQLLAA